jgi:DNA-binding MarR family transcriptional regulator
MSDFVESIGLPLFAHRLRRLSEVLVAAAPDWLPQAGVTAPAKAASTLTLLAAEGALSVTEIAQRLRLSHPLIIKLVRELEALGLASTAQDPTDGRRRPVSLTAAGRRQARRLAELNALIAEAYRGLFAEAGVDGLSAVERLEQALATRGMASRMRDPASVKRTGRGG